MLQDGVQLFAAKLAGGERLAELDQCRFGTGGAGATDSQALADGVHHAGNAIAGQVQGVGVGGDALIQLGGGGQRLAGTLCGLEYGVLGVGQLLLAAGYKRQAVVEGGVFLGHTANFAGAERDAK
ncbi:hypothetical protein D9M71_548470 [compost metagenome]